MFLVIYMFLFIFAYGRIAFTILRCNAVWFKFLIFQLQCKDGKKKAVKQ